MFAVAVRDSGGLFLLARIRRSPKGGIFVSYAHKEPKDSGGPKEWKNWDPHTSYHASGKLHQKWFGEKFIILDRPRPSSDFRGTVNLATLSVGRNVPRARAVICRPDQFSQVFEIPVSELRTGKNATYIAIDLVAPGSQPTLRPGARILRQETFDDAVPWILITVFEDTRTAKTEGTPGQVCPARPVKDATLSPRKQEGAGHRTD